MEGKMNNQQLAAGKEIAKAIRKTSIGMLLSAIVFTPHAWAANCKEQVEKGVKQVVEKQVADWNRGELDSFLTGYLKSPDISYVSDDGEILGYYALMARYAEKYGADKKSMGQLSFSKMRVVELGPKNALCVGHWSVKRNAGAPVEGVCSLVLENTDKGWKIIHDHSSSNLNLPK